MTEAQYREVVLFLVDDDDVDYMAVERAMRQMRLLNPLVRARDGKAALEMLKDGVVQGAFVILLDLNMPRMNGLEFLQALRANPQYASAVVFVLTTSRADEDKLAAYSFNVAGYVVKSNIKDEFDSIINMLDGYWRIVELPQL
ncbi:response regulator [Shewanella litorisediminis]|uniref:Response regulator n=1 Tax=Shewanella litorisediminis TaxID=1173586 RepID=A0ABX7G289_9GAMM|nr:response regulator [Shewanella litorisediminis]MCL2918543.1 response regulator [Shewanella litorisediminis]QRH01370.1 response regulator [Shewanella litorisediminis]